MSRSSGGASLGMPRNLLRACILLELAADTSHGYELLEGLEPFALSHTDPGGLYRALRAMEREGLVSSFWEDSPSGPPRRTYALTDAGREALDAYAVCVRDVRRALSAFVRRHEDLRPPVAERRP